MKSMWLGDSTGGPTMYVYGVDTVVRRRRDEVAGLGTRNRSTFDELFKCTITGLLAGDEGSRTCGCVGCTVWRRRDDGRTRGVQ